MNNIIPFFVCFLVILLTSVFDASYASAVAELFILLVGVLFCQTVKGSNRRGAYRVFCISYSIYIVIAYIFSLSFDKANFFAVSDSMRYLQLYQDSLSYFRGWEYLKECYYDFSDNNGLYNVYLQFWAALGNRQLGGATVFYMTLAQTLFGLLCPVALYKVIVRYSREKAVQYTIKFTCLSLCLFYSSVIIRDITIVLFFIYALDCITQEFRIYRLALLIILVFIVWGVRLYSGLFFSIFPILYIYLNMIGKSMSKRNSIVLLAIGFLLILPIVATTALGEQAQSELAGYEEFTQERNVEGMYTSLSHLPVGIKQIALTLYSQVSPFPPFGIISTSTNFSQFVIGLDIIVYEFYWFFVFFSVAYLFLVKSRYTLLSRSELILLLIALLYIMINTSHPDIRRMMPVYPFIYIVYIKYKESCLKKEIINTNRVLGAIYFTALLTSVIFME